MASADLPHIFLPVGEWQARLTLTAAGRLALSYVDPAGNPRARLARDVAARHRREVAAVKTRVTEIERTIGEVRLRPGGGISASTEAFANPSSRLGARSTR